MIALNQAVGGAGHGGSGGNGLGGGIFNGAPNPFGTPSLTLRRSLVVFNRAVGGAAGGGGTAGLGQGGGLYLAPGGVATADADGHLLQRCLHQRPRRVRGPDRVEGVTETSGR